MGLRKCFTDAGIETGERALQVLVKETLGQGRGAVWNRDSVTHKSDRLEKKLDRSTCMLRDVARKGAITQIGTGIEAVGCGVSSREMGDSI